MERWDPDCVDVGRRKSKALRIEEAMVNLPFEVSVVEC